MALSEHQGEKLVFKPALNLTEQIAEQLAEQIILGELQGQDRIQELKIAKAMDVSRGSVREALLILERRHLIEIVPRRGAVVTAIGPDEAVGLIELLAAAETQWLGELIERPKNNRLQRLIKVEHAVDGMEKAARERSPEDLVRQRGNFYLGLLDGAPKYTLAVFECLLPSSQVVLRQLLQSHRLDAHDVARYYRALHIALKESDCARVHELLNAFRKRMRQLCAETLPKITPQDMPSSVQRWHDRASALQG